MTKAEEFSKKIRDIVDKEMAVHDNLVEITNKQRPTYQFDSILFASVTNDGNMEMKIDRAIFERIHPICDPETALKFAQWILNTFGPDSTETRSHEYKTNFENASYTAEEIRAKESQT